MGGRRRIDGLTVDALPFVLIGATLTSAFALWGFLCFSLGVLLTR